MRKLIIFALLLSGCAVHKVRVDPPDPLAVAAADRQPVQSLLDVVTQHKPIVVLTGSQTVDDAVSACKMGDSVKWRCWVVLPDHIYGYMRNDIIEQPDGSAKLKTVWTPAGRWN